MLLMATSEGGMGFACFGGWERDRERRYETLAFATAFDRRRKKTKDERVEAPPPVTGRACGALPPRRTWGRADRVERIAGIPSTLKNRLLPRARIGLPQAPRRLHRASDSTLPLCGRYRSV